MEKFYNVVIRCRKLILVVFVIAAVILAFAKEFVAVNYDMNSYLPEDSPSTVALDVMNDEFDGGIPNARVLIYDVTIPEAGFLLKHQILIRRFRIRFQTRSMK